MLADEHGEPRDHLAVYLCLDGDEAVADGDVGSDGATSDGLAHHTPRHTQFELQVLDPTQTEKHVARAANIDIGVLRTWVVRSVVFSSDLRCASRVHVHVHGLHAHTRC